MSSHIIVCPTAFKGTISAAAATRAMARGAGEATGVSVADVLPIPLSDGGNGLLDAARHAAGGETRVARVPGPDGRFVEARYLVQNHQVIVETAEACGLHLVPAPGRDPLLATTAGVGALLVEAAAALPGAHAELVVGLGGSATVDAGAGMATALGWSLLDSEGEPILPCASGLLRLDRIVAPRQRKLPRRLRVLADVTNPLLGSFGAVRVYAPQKGASPRDLPILERALTRWADVARRTTGREVRALPGAGAAGGLGAAFAALFGAAPERGAAWVLDTVAFDRRLRSARAVVTGEGEWDAQSSMGKVTGEVLARARAAGVPVLLIAGRVSARVPDGVALRGGTGRTTGTLDAAALARHACEGLNGLLGRRGRL
ncbi:MAG: glycerate kinase [Gemmatimonadetes bacterium]|nr:glycerate kinase [Gemmatimonadota bacterium]